MTDRPILYGLLAEFDQPEDLLEAVERVRAAGYRRVEAYTPYPVEGLAEALGFHRTGVSLVVLIGGVLGCLCGYTLQYYVAVIAYPMNIGGRPLNSWPSFIPVTFEMTILFASLFAVLGMLGLNGLPRPHHPLFGVPSFSRATRDGFFLAVQATDPLFDPGTTRQFLESLHPREVIDVPE
jgi:hypothetical protein